MAEPRREPVVRIRPADAKDALRCRAALEPDGFRAEESLQLLVVRDADPDLVNDALVRGGARGRVVVREKIGLFLGWLVDRQGALEGRARNVRSLVDRVLQDGGLSGRYAPKGDEALLAAAAAWWRVMCAEGAPFLPWPEFVARFCDERPAA
jgi:hypothetical protein